MVNKDRLDAVRKDWIGEAKAEIDDPLGAAYVALADYGRPEGLEPSYLTYAMTAALVSIADSLNEIMQMMEASGRY